MSPRVATPNHTSTPGQDEHLLEEQPDALPSSGLYAAGNVHILVVDDDELIAGMIQEALTVRGFLVNTVSDSRQVQDALTHQEYQLIILDYVLPGLETDRVLEWMRESQPEASVIVVTAYPSIDSALNCMRAHTYDYLTKPFQIIQLQQTVTRCLESKGLLRLSKEVLKLALGNAIRKRRKALGMTLAKMAERTGISLGYLSQIELGKNSASIETLYEISRGLGLRMSELFQAVQSSW